MRIRRRGSRMRFIRRAAVTRHAGLSLPSIHLSVPRMPDDPQVDALKLPPHSIEAEQSVLGRPDARQRSGRPHRRRHRSRGLLRRRAPADLRGGDPADRGGRPADVVTRVRGARLDAEARLRRRPRAISARWSRTCPRRRTSATTRRSCASARSCASSRRPPARSPTRRTTRSGAAPAKCSTTPRRRCCTSRSRGRAASRTIVEIAKLLASVVERIEDLYNRDDPSDVTGVATGYTDLDRMTAGLAARRSGHRRRKTEHGQDVAWRSTSASTSRSC